MTSVLPLSAAQSGIWYALKAGAPASAYNIGEYIKIAGPINPGLFDIALHHVLAETQALCIRFVEHDGVPGQVIDLGVHQALSYLDISREAKPISAAETWMRADMARTVDPASGPFFTFALLKTASREFLWYVRFHHLVMDGFGGSLIARRAADVYSALAAGSAVDPSPFGSLGDLVKEDTLYRKSRHFESDRQFFLDLMANCPEPRNLAIRTSSAQEPFLRQITYLAPELIAQIENSAQRMELTFAQFTTLTAAVFIHRLTEAEDIVLGQFMTGRMTRTSRQTPAMARNIVPLRLQIRHDMRIDDLVTQLRRQARAVMRHQRYPIADLRRDLRRIDRPLIRQSVSVRTFDYDAPFAGARGTTHTISTGPVEDLNIHLVHHPSELGTWRLEFDANPDLYDTHSLALLQARFVTLLAAIDNPAALVGQLDILPSNERRQVVFDWNNTSADYPRNQTICDLFESQAHRTPNRVAVVFENARLTYRELDQLADRLARNLVRLGIRPNERVGLYVERSLEMVVGLLGILKAGGAYVPLDPNYPHDRLSLILDDAQPRVLVTQKRLPNQLQASHAAILCLDTVCTDTIDAERTHSATRPGAGDTACVLYTSGSTGRPKGVQIPHRAVVNFLQAMQREPGITCEDKVLAITSLSFDIAGLELYLPLVSGAQVTIAPADIAADGIRLAALIKDCAPTIMQATPTTWRLLLEAGWEGSRKLKILCGGEAWPADLAHALLQRCQSLWNMYGPTETTIWSAVARIELGQPVLIGPPIANTTFYVLDRTDQPAPIGVPGELYIGGDGVALGYLNQPELTAERFVVNPFSNEPASRMYKTGDLVRRGMDGYLEFLGRLDHQVKIRGFRIELGEIETVLRQHPDVRDAVVVARAGRAGEKQLVAYVTAADSSPPSTVGLRDLLRQKLPPHMMPSAFVAVDVFPTTPNGKIDRNALPSPDDQMRRDTSVAYVAPRTPMEELLAAFWRDRLGLRQIGVHDNVFDLGGDSLAILQLSLEIERATGQTVPMTSIFDAPTIARMAAILDGQPFATDDSPLVVLRPGTDGPPVFIIHPVGGSTMQLIPIAKTFPGRRRVYGVQARGLDGTVRPIDRVDAMADHYLKAIKQAQPQGPYLFAGMCFGGLVALEIARRLLEQGDTIGMLACLDTYPHPRYWPLSAKISYFVVRRVKEFVATLKLLGPREAGAYIITRFKALSQKITSRIKGGQAFINAPESLPPALKSVFDSGVAALENYRPRFYPGKVSFLMCGYHAYMPEGPRSVWAHLIGRLDVKSAPAWASPDYIAQWLFDRIQDAEREDFRLHEGHGEPMAGKNASYSEAIAVPAELVTADGPSMALRPGRWSRLLRALPQ